MMEEWKERRTDYDGLLQQIELVIGSYITASGQNDRLSNKNKTFFLPILLILFTDFKE